MPMGMKHNIISFQMAEVWGNLIKFGADYQLSAVNKTRGYAHASDNTSDIQGDSELIKK